MTYCRRDRVDSLCWLTWLRAAEIVDMQTGRHRLETGELTVRGKGDDWTNYPFRRMSAALSHII